MFYESILNCSLMKKLNSKFLLLLALCCFLFMSCTDNDSININDESLVLDEAIALVEVDDVSDEINNVIDDFFVESETSSRSEGKNPHSFFSCATKTIVIDGTNKIVTLDFGDGCELPNGNVLSGKIILIHNVDTDLRILTVVYFFENFYFNKLNVTGENKMVRVRKNENGNPLSTLTINITVTWPDLEFTNRQGTKIREWVEGPETRTFGDNVFLISGNWTATFKNGTVFTAHIIEPLRREMACRFIVSGIVEFDKRNRVGTLNFGEGTCDNKALFTDSEGVETEIELRKRMH